MRYCPKCFFVGGIRDKYCWRDGEKLVESEVCECGKDAGPIDRFCTNCGRAIKRKEVGDVAGEEQVKINY